MRAHTPRSRGPSHSMGAEPPAGGQEEPLLPGLALPGSHVAIWLSAAPAPQAPTFREGLFAAKAGVWGSGEWHATWELGKSGRLPRWAPGWLCRLLGWLGLGPPQSLVWSRRVPSRISAQGEPSWLPPPPHPHPPPRQCYLHASVCWEHTQDPPSPPTAFTDGPPPPPLHPLPH